MEDFNIRVVGDIKLTPEEKEFLKLNPKFAVEERLNSEDMEVETEMGLAKYRYQIVKEDEVMEEIDDEVIADDNDENNRKKKKRRRLEKEEEELLEKIELIEAEGRQVYDTATKTFDYSKKRTTDLKENSEVKLPLPCDPMTESAINVVKKKIMDVFRHYKKKECDNEGRQETNLSKSELKGLNSLKKRVAEGELIALKTDKSGIMTLITTEE